MNDDTERVRGASAASIPRERQPAGSKNPHVRNSGMYNAGTTTLGPFAKTTGEVLASSEEKFNPCKLNAAIAYTANNPLWLWLTRGHAY